MNIHNQLTTTFSNNHLRKTVGSTFLPGLDVTTEIGVINVGRNIVVTGVSSAKIQIVQTSAAFHFVSHFQRSDRERFVSIYNPAFKLDGIVIQ